MQTTQATQDAIKDLNPTAFNASNAGTATSRAASAVEQKVNEVKEQIETKGAEFVDQTKQVMSDAYDKTSQVISENYHKAVDYSRDNPGATSLIALGAGIGVGIGIGFMLANNSSRSRTSRIVPPVMNALTNLAYELFKR